ncbi:hypothetical protein M3152_08365 [Sporosarcina luteola]|uniref:hypothetical protein n=1 Tax=Sporosarcina luteola TaxID=582850 RepID=UPI00203A97DB|nr:hypothetical protein [Sporosarcina luteola]MCM3637734.1 hypothetical protein [Sporosarcina luteola]
MQHDTDGYGLVKWQVFHLAQALTRAKRMEKLRSEFFEELYESIVYPSVNLDYNNPVMHSAKVDNQAIRIIEAKERYDKKVQQEYEKHFRWNDLLAWAREKDRPIMIRYFQKKKYVEPRIIFGILVRLQKRIEHEEFMMDMESNERAREAFKIHRKDFMDKYKVKVLLDHTDVQSYLINGRFVKLTPEEYQAHQEKQEAMQTEFEKRIQEIREAT